ncbi:MAG TPA: endonuclease/exonuclease/phosphatase family protein [Opitutaceae bacterium]
MSTFRVLQFNMQFGQVWDNDDPDGAPVNLDAAIAEIWSHDADVVMLQEVERGQPGGVQLHPPPNYTRLRAALADYDSFFSYPTEDSRELPFGIGLAIFSRTPLRETFHEQLPSPPVEFDFYGERTTPTDRLLIGAKTTIASRDLLLLNTHLLAFFMLKSSSEVYGGQRSRVAQRLKSVQGPAVLSGDFNVSKHTSLVDQFAESGFYSVQTAKATWRRRPYVLDHIFHNASLRCVAHRVVPTSASDHHALVADFDFV